MKTTLSVLLVFLSACTAYSQSDADIRKGILKTIKKYKNYHAVYDKWFKFCSDEDDTAFSMVEINVQRIFKNAPFTGNARIKSKYGLTEQAFKGKESVNFNHNDSSYYAIKPGSYGLDYFNRELRENLYKPLGFDAKILESFMNIKDSAEFYVLQYNETIVGDQKDSTIFNTRLCVNRSSFIPSLYEQWAWFDGGVQYEKLVLRKIDLLDSMSMKEFYKFNEAKIHQFKSGVNGDSISKLRRKQYVLP